MHTIYNIIYVNPYNVRGLRGTMNMANNPKGFQPWPRSVRSRTGKSVDSPVGVI